MNLVILLSKDWIWWTNWSYTVTQSWIRNFHVQYITLPKTIYAVDVVSFLDFSIFCLSLFLFMVFAYITKLKWMHHGSWTMERCTIWNSLESQTSICLMEFDAVYFFHCISPSTSFVRIWINFKSALKSKITFSLEMNSIDLCL